MKNWWNNIKIALDIFEKKVWEKYIVWWEANAGSLEKKVKRKLTEQYKDYLRNYWKKGSEKKYGGKEMEGIW